MSIDLFTPILEGGIHNTNFFNGRILTADDLKNEQEVNRKQRQRLGKAIGEGIVQGLEVSLISSGKTASSRPILSIAPGLALNRLGQTLYLSSDTQVSILKEKGETTDSTGIFSECVPRSYYTGTGLYLLVISPGSGYEEWAPMSGLFSEGRATECGSRYNVEGVQFKRVKFDPGIDDTARKELEELMNKNDTASVSKFRNIIAHLCFGTAKVAGFVSNPFERKDGTSPFTTYNVLDKLRSLGGLNDCDVPLAMFNWTDQGIQFVDMWSVRRKLSARGSSGTWPLPFSDRRVAEEEAVFQQFQEQIESIVQSARNRSELASIEALNYFRYLPAAGLLPITAGYVQEYQASEKSEPVAGMSGGFYPPGFFRNMTYRKPVFIEGARFEALMRESLSFPPIDLRSKEMVWLYLVRENVESIAKGSQPYIIFTSGHVPYQGNARYDLARWDRSNYSIMKRM